MEIAETEAGPGSIATVPGFGGPTRLSTLVSAAIEAAWEVPCTSYAEDWTIREE